MHGGVVHSADGTFVGFVVRCMGTRGTAKRLYMRSKNDEVYMHDSQNSLPLSVCRARTCQTEFNLDEQLLDESVSYTYT
jgi:hypothetical protein